jgi:hypothetical protein
LLLAVFQLNLKVVAGVSEIVFDPTPNPGERRNKYRPHHEREKSRQITSGDYERMDG